MVFPFSSPSSFSSGNTTSLFVSFSPSDSSSSTSGVGFGFGLGLGFGLELTLRFGFFELGPGQESSSRG